MFHRRMVVLKVVVMSLHYPCPLILHQLTSCPLWSSSRRPAGHFQPQQPSSHIFPIPPLDMSKPSGHYGFFPPSSVTSGSASYSSMALSVHHALLLLPPSFSFILQVKKTGIVTISLLNQLCHLLLTGRSHDSISKLLMITLTN